MRFDLMLLSIFHINLFDKGIVTIVDIHCTDVLKMQSLSYALQIKTRKTCAVVFLLKRDSFRVFAMFLVY